MRDISFKIVLLQFFLGSSQKMKTRNSTLNIPQLITSQYLDLYTIKSIIKN